MDKYLYSDLACERYSKDSNIEIRVEDFGEFYVEESVVCAAEAVGAGGKYTTIHSKQEWGAGGEIFEKQSHTLSGILSKYLCEIDGRRIFDDDLFAVIGLGNPVLTPDSLGARVVKNIFVSAHMSSNVRSVWRKPRVCAFTPDVTGNTGIETADTVSAIVSAINPKAVIMIDSLASRSLERLSKTVQISNVGLIPGSGIGEPRAAIDSECVGVPIVSIGVPTVIRLSTAIYDSYMKCGYEPVPSVLENCSNFFVCPKDIDRIVSSNAMLISDAINRTLKCGL